MNKTVGKHVKALRIDRGLTQDALAERLHVVRQTVSCWETGKTEPDIDTLVAIAEALSVDVTELIYGPKQKDDFAAMRPKRIRRAVIFAALFLFFLVLALTWQPLLQALGLPNTAAETFDLFSPRSQLYVYCSAFLPTLAYFFGGMALVAAFGVFLDFRLRRLVWRLALAIPALLLLSSIFIVMILIYAFRFSVGVYLPWYPLVYLLFHQPVFFFPGLALGIAVN